MTQFYPERAPQPAAKRTSRLSLRPLSVTHVQLDYEAVIESAGELRRWSQSEWPAAGFTLAENREDLQRHEREHDDREAFTFTVLSPDETRCLGCVYIQPLDPNIIELCGDAEYPARVGFWVRTSELAGDLDKHLLATLREWLAAAWVFDAIVFVISESDARQAEILNDAGLERLNAVALTDGRSAWVFR